MSENRQHFTGNLSIFFLFWIVLVVIVWWLPTTIMSWFPGLSMNQLEPWLMTPEDLTWERALLNVITKPGFRVITASLLGIVCFGLRKLVIIMRGKRLVLRSLRWNGEWAMEDRMQSNLLEYGRWVGVVQ